MRDVDWDYSLGSNNLDVMLGEHFAAQFAAKHKIPLEAVLGNSRAMAKMKKQVSQRGAALTPNHKYKILGAGVGAVRLNGLSR